MSLKHRGAFLVGLLFFALFSWSLAVVVPLSRAEFICNAPEEMPLSDTAPQGSSRTDAASDESSFEAEGDLDLIAPSSLSLSAPHGAHVDFCYRFLLPDPVFSAPDEPPNKPV